VLSAQALELPGCDALLDVYVTFQYTVVLVVILTLVLFVVTN
jgi:hypothetical protein